MYYNQCEFCGANLDPNEKCDCRKENIKETVKNTVEQLSFKDKIRFA